MKEYESLKDGKQLLQGRFSWKWPKGPFCKKYKIRGRNVKKRKIWGRMSLGYIRLGMCNQGISCIPLYEPRD